MALKQQEEGYSIKQNIKESKKMSSVPLAKNGVIALDNQALCKAFTKEFSAKNKKQLIKPRNDEKSSIQISTKSKLQATNMDMILNTCSKNLIYPNVLLTYNINAIKMMLQLN